MGYEDKPSCLFSHHFNNHPFVALAIEFGVEDLLPRAEVEPAVGDRDDDFVVNAGFPFSWRGFAGLTTQLKPRPFKAIREPTLL